MQYITIYQLELVYVRDRVIVIQYILSTVDDDAVCVVGIAEIVDRCACPFYPLLHHAARAEQDGVSVFVY